MNIKEIIANINRSKYELEAALEENGGELTPELLALNDNLEDMKALLADEGVDELGRWLKSVQDEKAALKAEADAAARRVKNLTSYEDYVKGLVGEAMDALDLPTNDKGEKVAKGQYYGFKRTTSTTNKVDEETLNSLYLTRIEMAMQRALIPEYVHIKLTASTKELQQAGGKALDLLNTTETPALSFTKPRAAKEV